MRSPWSAGGRPGGDSGRSRIGNCEGRAKQEGLEFRGIRRKVRGLIRTVASGAARRGNHGRF